jgi:hypothetical protein
VGIWLAGWLSQLLGCGTAQAQYWQKRRPSFQSDYSDSLQAQMFERMARTGRYEPEDLPVLARLEVLHAISMLVNTRTDLFEGGIGDPIGQQIGSLWDAGQLFFESTFEAPIDVTNRARNDFLFAQLIAAHGQAGSILGELRAFSDRAAAELDGATLVLGVTYSVLGLTDAEVLNALPAPVRALDLGAMRTETQLLANDLVALLEKVKAYEREKKDAGAAQRYLDAALARIQEFERKLPLELSLNDLVESYRLAERSMRHVEAELMRLDLPAGLPEQWRQARQRANAISDAFGLPRTIELAANPQPAAAAISRSGSHRGGSGLEALVQSPRIIGEEAIHADRREVLGQAARPMLVDRVDQDRHSSIIHRGQVAQR